MQDIISTLKNALQQAEAGLEVAVGRLAKDGTERGNFKPSEALALAIVREALAMPVTCLHQIQEPPPVHDSDCATYNAPAYPAGACDCSIKAAPAAVAVPDGMAAFEKLLDASMTALTDQTSAKEHVQIWDDAHDALEAWKARAALAATPAAPELHREWRSAFQEAIDTMEAEIDSRSDAENVRRMKRATSVLRSMLAATPVVAAPRTNTDAVIAAPVELLERVIDSLSSFAGNKPHTEADMTAWEQLNNLLSAAAAPVVLPEPVAYSLGLAKYAHSSNIIAANEFTPDTEHADEWENLYTEHQVRALLAGVSAPAALANTPDSFREWFAKNYPADTIILDPDWHAKSIFRMAQAHARISAPQAQTDAREAQLLAFAVSEIRRDEMEHAPVLYVSKGQLDNFRDPDGPDSTAHGRYLPARVTPAGKFTTPLFAAPQDQAADFQQRVQPWMMACFGPEISADRIERNHRFLEESLELVQSLGCTASEAHQLVDYVFGRPVGEPVQETGGVMVTLAALCLASGLDMHACGETELARIWTKVGAIRAKQAAKPKHSPLPMHAPQTQDALQQVRQAVRDFHYALDSRTHGGVAAGAAMNAIEMALNMYWHQGQEADRRAAIAAQAAQQGGAA